MSSADYDAGMEHTLNPQEIDCQREIKDCHSTFDGGPKSRRRSRSDGRASSRRRAHHETTRSNRLDQKLNVAPICRIRGNRIVAGRR